MSSMLLGILNAQAAGGAALGGGYWIANISGSGASTTGGSIGVDGAGSNYRFGQTSVSGEGQNDFIIVKSDSNGTVDFQKTLGGTLQEYYKVAAIDSSNNLYTLGRTTSGVPDPASSLAKWDSSGTLQWQRTVVQPTGYAMNPNGMAIDSSGNIYISGYVQRAAFQASDGFLIKYNSSGTIQFQKSYQLAYTGKIAIDSLDNIYTTNITEKSNPYRTVAALVKYNTSGTLQWQREFTGNSAFNMDQTIAFDNSNNPYFVGRVSNEGGSGGNEGILVKYNTSGTLQWQRVIYGTDTVLSSGVASDSDGNLYVVGYTDSSPSATRDIQIAKYNTAGTLQWQRVLGGTASAIGANITFDSLDDMYIQGYSTTGSTFGTNGLFTAKLPKDGSLVGVYDLGGDEVTYQEGNLNTHTSSFASTTASISTGDLSLTPGTSSLTVNTSSLTQAIRN